MDKEIEWVLIEIILRFIVIEGKWEYDITEFLWIVVRLLRVR
jgi:hypothetical protein